MSISVVIPCFNEAKRLPLTLQEISNFCAKNERAEIIEIIIVDDGSQDDTTEIVLEWTDRLPLQLIRLEVNQGKGAALKAGVKIATGNWILLFDADSATPISMLGKFLPHANSHTLIIGSRMLPDSQTNMSALRRIIGHAYYLFTKPLIGNVRDAACGFKLIEAETARKLFRTMHINRFAYDVELFVQAHQQHVKILEVPVEWHEVSGSTVHLLRDGLQMLGDVLHLYAGLLAAKVYRASGKE